MTLKFNSDPSAGFVFTTFVSGGPHTGTPADTNEIEVMEEGADFNIVIMRQVVAGLKPIFRSTSSPMVFSCLDFDGTANRLTSTDDSGASLNVANFYDNNAKTVIVVVHPQAITGTSASYYLNDLIVGDQNGFFVVGLRTNGGVPKVGVYNFDGVDSPLLELTIALNATSVVSVRHDAGSLYLSINGGTESSVSSNATTNLSGFLAVGLIAGAQALNGCLGPLKIWNTGNADGNFASEVAAMVADWVSGAGPSQLDEEYDWITIVQQA